jgi:hypothetical protein
MAKRHELNLHVPTRQAVLVAGEARQAGRGRKRGWFHRFSVGTEPQLGHHGKFAFVAIVMKQVGFGNWYSKIVKDQETGELLRHCEEPLDQHRGHGSAKRAGTVI